LKEEKCMSSFKRKISDLEIKEEKKNDSRKIQEKEF
jgi:hypothetical protein